MKCTKCGTNNPIGDECCSRCGSKIVKYCPECHEPAALNAEFCLYCGEYLPKEENTTTTATTNSFFTNTEKFDTNEAPSASTIKSFSGTLEARIYTRDANIYQSAGDMNADFEFEPQNRNGTTVSVLRKITNVRNTTITIPAQDGQGNPVVDIAARNKPYSDKLGVCPHNVKRCIIPDSVTSIGQWAFYYCKDLTEINIPNGVTSIGAEAFIHSGLKTIAIPDSVTSIGEEAFYGCSGLTSITIPDSVTYFGERIFANCSNLGHVSFPKSFSHIGKRMFSYCGFKTITIPRGITCIDESAFTGCEKLRHVTFPNTLTSIGDNAFQYCSALTEVNIPDSVVTIGESAFYGCDSINKFTIGSGVKRLGKSFFCFTYDDRLRDYRPVEFSFNGTRAQWRPIAYEANYSGLDIVCADEREQHERALLARAAQLAEETQKRERRAKNLCQHCGGTIKVGWFSSKCEVCGRLKDY